MFTRLFNNHFFRSGVIFSVANFIVSVIGYFINLLIARVFSLADYGEYMTAMSYIWFLSVPISTFGMIVTQRIGREISSQRKKVALDLEHWLISELKIHVLIITVFSILFFLIAYYKGNIGLAAIAFIFISTVLSLFQSFYTSAFQALKNFTLAGLILVVIIAGKLILSMGVVALSPLLVNIYLAFILATLIGVGFGRMTLFPTATQANQKVTHHFLNVFAYLKRKNLLITLITTFGIVGLASIDVILVKKFLPADQAGLYSSISLIGKIIIYLTTPLSQVAFSFYTGSESKQHSHLILIALTFLFGVIGGFTAIIYYLYPELVVNLIFGSKYLVISNLIWLAAIVGTLYSLVTLYAQYFIAKNSWWGALASFTLVCQTFFIYFNHADLKQVLMVNIGVLTSLFVVSLIRVTSISFNRS